jgi:hypothetical protein
LRRAEERHEPVCLSGKLRGYILDSGANFRIALGADSLPHLIRKRVVTNDSVRKIEPLYGRHISSKAI